MPAHEGATVSRDRHAHAKQLRRHFGVGMHLLRERMLPSSRTLMELTQGDPMIRRIFFAAAAATLLTLVSSEEAQAQQAYGRAWGSTYNTMDWDRFYHYPYVYYPQNFWGNEYYRSADSLYFRYPPEMRIPVYNRHWFNYYPSPRPYHRGHHFVLDVF
jgi:hypothetical protein